MDLKKMNFDIPENRLALIGKIMRLEDQGKLNPLDARDLTKKVINEECEEVIEGLTYLQNKPNQVKK